MKNVAFHNLGCKVNSYEMDVMQQMMTENGYSVVPFDERADVYVVNTCTVTNIADRKSRQMLHRAKQLNPDAIVVAVGCYVQTAQGGVADECVDLAVGNNRKKDIVKLLERFFDERERCGGKDSADKTLGGESVIDISRANEYEEMKLSRTAEHTRAYIKIQDGCSQFCSYCVIPFVRGRVRSRQPEDILREICGLVEAGYREIVLTGIHISSYGTDFDGQKSYAGDSRLIGLLERIRGEVPELRRIRLGSLEPRLITRETAGRLSAIPGLCPHFHLSLQSGCEETLKRMNRHYTPGEYLQGVQYLRDAFEHPAITTDVIVGFPGESEEEFDRTVDFVKQVGFYEMHIFKYSRRSGTRAASMPQQLTEKVKAARSEVLFGVEREQSKAFRSFYIGKKAEVLWENCREIDGRPFQIGYTPDYVKIAIPAGDRDLSGEIEEVCVEGFLTEEILLGRQLR